MAMGLDSITRPLACRRSGRPGGGSPPGRPLGSVAETAAWRRCTLAAALLLLAEVSAAELIVEVRNGALHVTATDVPLVEVLNAIRHELQAELFVSGDLTRTVTRRIGGQTILAGLRELVEPAALVVVYAPAQSPEATRSIEQIRVYSGLPGGQSLLGEPPSPAPSVEPDGEPREVLGLAPDLEIDERNRAIEELAGVGDAHAVQTLGLILTDDPYPEARARAASALGRIGGEKVVDALVAGLRDVETTIREAVVVRLGAIGGERAVLGLGQVVSSEQDPLVRMRALEQLIHRRGDGARTFLESAAKEDPDARIRRVALQALRRK